MENRYISMAIAQLTNGAEYVWIGNDLSDIQWITKGITTPSQKQIDDKIKEIKASEIAAKSAIEQKLAALGLTAQDLKSIL